MVQASSTRMSRLQQATQGLEERLQDREQQLLTYQVKLQQLQGLLARREAEMRALPEPAVLEQLQRQVGIIAGCRQIKPSKSSTSPNLKKITGCLSAV